MNIERLKQLIMQYKERPTDNKWRANSVHFS